MKNLLNGIKRLFGVRPQLTQEAARDLVNESMRNCTSQWFDADKEKARLRKHITDNYAPCNFIVVLRRYKPIGKTMVFRWIIFTRHGEPCRYEATKKIRVIA